MTTQEKFWYLIGPVMLSFSFAATYPVIQVYFINLIGPEILAISNILGTSLSIIVNWTIPKKNMKSWYRKHFLLIVISDVVLTCLFTFFGYQYPAIRFLGFSFLNAVSTCLWVMIMRNVVNRIITDGDQRTDFDALVEYVTLSGSLAGAITALIFSDIPVEYCLFFQCISNAIFGLTDIYIFRRLNKTYNLEL